jgi:ribosomal protein S18 acetylase RimI-like enzyme
MHASIRPALLADQRQISRLIQNNTHLHRHLDWRSPVEWLGTPPFFLLEDQNSIRAVMGCPPDPPRIAWLRLFACAEAATLGEDWEALLAATRAYLASRGEHLLAAICLQDWLAERLRASGLDSHQSIVMLEAEHARPQPVVLPAGVSLRPMMYYDLPAVAQVDASAFELLWQNTLEALQLAFRQAILASVVETEGRMVGYQLSTRNPFGAHLARLAVSPEFQHLGLGRALVCDLLEQAEKRGMLRLTVNTQSDNGASLRLYRALGFRETGERYPVYIQPLGADRPA